VVARDAAMLERFAHSGALGGLPGEGVHAE